LATNEQLDKIADRLGALYQAIGRITPSVVDATTWAEAMDELVSVTRDLERATGRAKRARDERERWR